MHLIEREQKVINLQAVSAKEDYNGAQSPTAVLFAYFMLLSKMWHKA